MYGSGIGSHGMNNRGLKTKFKPTDFTESHLINHERNMNISDKGHSFFGADPKQGSRINGSIVDVPEDNGDADALIKDETGDSNYKVKDVTSDIRGSHVDKIHSFISNPEKDKPDLHQKSVKISAHYKKDVKMSLLERTPKFQRSFEETTSPKGILSNPTRES